MRVIAGTLRSRHLQSPRGLQMRPTSDRLKETLFSVLAERVVGARFVDAFAGTGAVGIEALSRGAREVIFLEKHARAVALIEKNLSSLGIHEHVRILAGDALGGFRRLAAERWGTDPAPPIVFLDPPYAAAGEYSRVLAFLASNGALPPDALVIAEHRSKFDLPEELGMLARVRVLRQGDASLSFYRCGFSNPPNQEGGE